MRQNQNILILGAAGQIGHEAARALKTVGEITAPTHAELDLTNPTATREMLRHLRPSLVVNAAGYTDVDGAESDVAQCADVNAHAPALLAEEARRIGALFVHLSTDYVFDGRGAKPFVETDVPAPLNVYGRTKLDGERAVIAAAGAFLILRTSWVYAARGRNFPLTMLRLAREREIVNVVNDQVGAPTSARAVAHGLAMIVDSLSASQSWFAAGESRAGVYHITAAGATTWFDFAATVLAADPAPEEQVCREIRAISSAEFAAPAIRPRYSVLDNSKIAQQFGVQLPHWEDQWREVAAELRVNARRASSPGEEAHRADRPTT